MDEVQRIAAAPDSGLFQSNGLFSKLIDTGLDAYAISRTGTQTSTAPGTVYPTGQYNPGIVASEGAVNTPASAPSNGAAMMLKAMPWVLGAAGLIVVAAIAYRFAKR